MSANPKPVAGDASAPIQANDARVLIVDDLRSSRMLIGSVLKAAGFTNLDYAVDGLDALERFRDNEPDVVVLDIVMPRMDGFEVCHEIRNTLKSDVPILIQSGVQEGNQRVRAFDEGASDLVSKPINAAELVSRLRLHIERRRMIDRLQRYQHRMEEELHAAESMQMSLLKTPEELAELTAPRGAEVEAFYRASHKLGGDLWEAFEVDEDRFGLLMFDLSGHGVNAAINAFRLHMLINSYKKLRKDPAAWLAQVSNDLYRMLPVEHFSTGFYGIFDRRDRTLTYAGAGAPTPVLIRGDEAIELDGSGVIMGCLPSAEYETRSIQLQPCDQLCLYSDALYEDFDDPTQSLEVGDLVGHIRTGLEQREAAGFADALVRSILGHFPDSMPDDLTILRLEVK
ncbi:MAG: fused response regulator/phosphatase [Maricaulis sp.]|jgi:sigma-B regulation protein RsbU (phosphoserine phosphatase)|uniref:PP2C family protein-serine/threonine phosphatase n=1 Tax=Maricaulis sp. TaxID=1486257 RepID=UPI001B1106DC|nr:fused response regulator/phosphatase [Maricaulis sp.]MBO6729823.1 fused response regulator/phosphatase [Maricaulis sp.]MBO6846020.1 fused response regulator/phosphatase [Maricaulis sp.]MBO6876104.1 fused response regulator/phosphatase [Maricaulis sp.]MDM7983730.1 fused response regulator/phosphatase [Maricaulis sp.]